MSTRERSEEIYEHSGQFGLQNELDEGSIRRYSSGAEWRRLIGVLMGLVCLVLIFAVVDFFFFRLETVEVEKGTDFDTERILAGTGLVKGQNLLFINTRNVASSIRRSNPYVGSVKVKKVLPSKIRISAEKAQGAYYVVIGGNVYILDGSFRVIAREDSVEEAEMREYIRIDSKKIGRCVVGSGLTFHDIDMMEILQELIGFLDENKMLGFCSSVRLDSKFDIRFVYQDRFEVKLGDLYDLEIKLHYFEQILADNDVNASGVIDVSDPDLHEGILSLYE